jgi:hypothetical protein
MLLEQKTKDVPSCEVYMINHVLICLKAPISTPTNLKSEIKVQSKYYFIINVDKLSK